MALLVIPNSYIGELYGEAFYLEYRETKDAKRAVAAGVYDGISTFLVPSTYNIYVKKMSEEVALSVFSDLFQTPILGHGKSGVLDGIFGKTKKQENKNGSTLKKNSNSNFSTKKMGKQRKTGKIISLRFQKKCKI